MDGRPALLVVWIGHTHFHLTPSIMGRLDTHFFVLRSHTRFRPRGATASMTFLEGCCERRLPRSGLRASLLRTHAPCLAIDLEVLLGTRTTPVPALEV